MILLFKLSSGELVIGNVVGNSATSFDLSYPGVFVQQGLEPYMGFGMGKVTLYISNIVASTIPNPTLETSYNEAFGPNSTTEVGCTK
jgi:hypothetical protein